MPWNWASMTGCDKSVYSLGTFSSFKSDLVQQSTVAIVPTNTPTFSPSGLAKLTSPFFSPTTETSPPSQISNGQSTVTASVVPAVVLLVLGLLALTIVLLVVKRRRKRRRMKASHNISW